MKVVLSVLVMLAAWAGEGMAWAQERIYRCGNEYTNAIPAGQKNCKLMSGGNVTVLQKQSFSAPGKGTTLSLTRESAPRVDPAEQRMRDADARQILESERQKISARQQELIKTYNNGEPEKVGGEQRNHQKYLDRVAAMKSEIERNDSDLAGVQRELERLPTQMVGSGSK